MVSKRKILIITVLLSGAVSIWGSFHIMPYNSKLPRFNKERFENTENKKEYICSNHGVKNKENCIPVKEDEKK